jgi:uncharacterized protein (TIGR02594 family)
LIEDFAKGRGTADAGRALEQAEAIGQPAGSAIYFAVDWDFFRPADLAVIRGYFEEVSARIGGRYRIGVYGSGTVALAMRAAGLAEYVWLSLSTGWSGYEKALASGHVGLIQKAEKRWPGADFGYDENVVAPGFTDIGAFISGSAPAPVAASTAIALYAVNARNGLNLRRGPGIEYDVISTLPEGTLVHGLSRKGDWLLSDGQGDGIADGFLSIPFLRPFTGGLATAAITGGKTPLDFAKEELARGVCGMSGEESNERINEYHASTGFKDYDDEDAWCSSFVNWCFKQAGLTGTNHPGARSWHDQNWGSEVTKSPEPGDIAVFSRTGGNAKSWSGHVGFFLGFDGDSVRLLGGNQGNCVSVANFPRDGVKGSYHFRLLSVRRP